jgi:twinkle protein
MQIENGIYRSPTLYDVSGSADFRNQTHDGFSVYRYFSDQENNGYVVFNNLKTKYSFQGTIGGKVEFEYHAPSGRFYQRGTQPMDHNLLEDKKQREREFLQEIAPFPLVDAKDAFGESFNINDEILF